MNVVEYGKGNKKVIILLHGGGLSWWNYREVAELLQKEYHVVLPILDGHAGSDRDFVSIESQASEIILYIDENFGGAVFLIGGVSLGGLVLAEMLSQRYNICENAIVESALVLPMKLMSKWIKPTMDMSYGLIKQRWFSKLQFWQLKLKQELFEDYYRDSSKITKENMISILESNFSYELSEDISKTTAKVYITAGRKEQKQVLDSARYLQKMIQGSTIKLEEKMFHGELSANHPEKYVSIIRSMER